MAALDDTVFGRLRDILRQHASSFTVSEDTPARYCLSAPVGPATLRAWGGKLKRTEIPVAWVEAGKSYVSFHLMALNDEACAGMSAALAERRHGRTCFNFRTLDEPLFEELAGLTARGFAAFSASGYIAT